MLTNIFFFFFNDTATTEIYTLSLHDALPISPGGTCPATRSAPPRTHSQSPWPHTGQTSQTDPYDKAEDQAHQRSEEHTSELQSQSNLVCRLLLEKKKYTIMNEPSLVIQPNLP